MLKKSLRLSTAQFLAVMEGGKSAHSPLFLLRYLSGQKDTKISVTASKKEAKTAVARNKIRRRGYEALASQMPFLMKGTHAIVFMKSKTTDIEFENLKKEIKDLFIRGGIIKH